MPNDLWAQRPQDRLRAAKNLPVEELAQLHEELGRGCPVAPWPYGNATAINPFLVTLGVSPGNSPRAGDGGPVSASGHKFPTAGMPHPGTRYRDTAGYWEKLRCLARVALMATGSTEDDALALFGNLNLDTGRSGKAEDVVVKSELAEWVLRTIHGGLRPRHVVMLGLLSYLRANRNIAAVFEKVFPGFKLSTPTRQIPFKAYAQKKLVFREWDIESATNRTVTLTMWPQHPSRAPFSNTALWEASCCEFAARHGLPMAGE